MDWIQKYKAVIDMNKERITFRVNERKFTTKLVSDTQPQNKVHYYIMSELKDIIDLTLTEDNITEALDGDDKSSFDHDRIRGEKYLIRWGYNLNS